MRAISVFLEHIRPLRKLVAVNPSRPIGDFIG